MARFTALTSRGLVDVLHEEVAQLPVKSVRVEGNSVSFECSWAECYRANLLLKTATRIVLPILDFPPYQPDDLYNNIKRHDFTKYIDPDQTLVLDVSVRDSSFRDQRFVAMKIKDAIVDQFSNKFGRRPDVDKDNPDLRVLVRVVKNQVSLAIDTSGETLSMRGYRDAGGVAPLREHLAAGLLQLAGWQPGVPLVDPMCGSGTFIIEAALQELGMAPGLFRRDYGFKRLKNYEDEKFKTALREVRQLKHMPASEPRLFGSDISGRAIRDAESNARMARVSDYVSFSESDFRLLQPPKTDPGIIIVNPPYGERLSSSVDITRLYGDFSRVLKERFKGWTLWLLSGSEDLTQHLHLKAERKIPVFNGNIECRFLKYEIR